MSEAAEKRIAVSVVTDAEERMKILPRYLGSALLEGESLIYHFMGKLCQEYHGGMWDMLTLGNGAFYMRPSEGTEYHMVWPDNYFDGTVTADAAGIIACLYAFNTLCWKRQEDERYRDLYYGLRDFAAHHAEADSIFAAIG